MYLHTCAVKLWYKRNITLIDMRYECISARCDYLRPTAKSQPCRYTAISHVYECEIAYKYGVSIYTKCKKPALLADAIYTNSAHQRVIGTVNTEKRRSLNISFSGVDGKACAFWRDRPEFEPTFCRFFSSSPFSNLIWKFISIKMKEIIKKSKKYRVGLG